MRAAAGTDDISGADNPGGVAPAAGKLTAAQQAAYRQYVTAIAPLVPAGTAHHLCPDADGAEGTPGGSVALLTAPE